jgi:hypothetical protein
MKRTSLFLFGLTFLLAGCRDLGLPGNVPAEEARTATPPELVAQVLAPAERDDVRLVVDGRLWVAQGQPFTRGAGDLRPVGATAGLTVYARAWDERPYRAIFTRVTMPAPEVATTARGAMDARLDHWQEYAPVIGQRGRATRPARVRPDPAEDELAPGDAEPMPTDEEAGAVDGYPRGDQPNSSS